MGKALWIISNGQLLELCSLIRNLLQGTAKICLKTLYPRQEQHASQLSGILDKFGSALDSSDTGTGKTICATKIAEQHYGEVLVICPKAVIPAWGRELKDHNVPRYNVVNYEKVRNGKSPYGRWDKKKWVWNLPEGSLIIFDEAHRCGGIDTQNARMLIEAKDRYKVLMLSATIASSPTQMRAAGFLLGAHGLGNFWQWCLKNGCAKNRWNGVDFMGEEKHIKNIAAQISHRCSRMTVEELSDHFPETQIITEPLDFGGELNKIYEEMESELQALTAKADTDKKNSAAEALVAQLRARQRVELLKVPVMVEMVQDLLAEGKSVAVFVNFQQTLDALSEKLQTSCVISGKQSASTREVNIEDFQNDKERVILCNTAAGGVGISLHDVTGKHPRAAIISPDWNEKNIVQVIGRVHRAGGKTPSLQRILFAAGTVEEKVERSVRKKISNLELLNAESTCAFSNMGVIYPDTKSSTGTSSVVAESAAPLNESPDKTTMSSTSPAEIITHADSAKRPHAEHSPSSLKHFEACPSYVGRKGTSPIAEAGTRIHEAIERGDESMLVDDTERALATACLEFLANSRRQKESTAKRIASHQELELKINLGGNSTFGTSDMLELYDDGTGIAYDWKTGYNKTEDAEINAQVFAYTLGFFQKFPKLNKLTFFLVFPRRQEISHATFTREDVGRIKLRLSTIIARAKELAGVEFNPTEGTCDYCSRQGTCKALADKALTVGYRANFEIPEDMNLDGSRDSKAKLLKLANLMGNWASETKAELLRQALEEGVEIPGYRLDQRRTARTIDQPLQGYDAVKHMVTIEEYLKSCTRVSVPELEKFVAEKAPRGQKVAKKQELEDALRDGGALKEEGVIHILKPIRE